MCSEPRQSVRTRIIGKISSEHRFVRAARIFKRSSCIKISVTYCGCKKQTHSAFLTQKIFDKLQTKSFCQHWMIKSVTNEECTKRFEKYLSYKAYNIHTL